MTLQAHQLRPILDDPARELDISPTQYRRAVESYTAVGNWLKDGYREAYPTSTAEPEIYPQGSMRLGTVVRPLKEGRETDFDVDLVCELQTKKAAVTPSSAKKQVGDRMKANATYQQRLANEGRRCWTLEYAHTDGIAFHIDILPCVPDPDKGIRIFVEHMTNPDADTQFTGTTVAITHRDEGGYEWRSSNPKGYGDWFGMRNAVAFERVKIEQKLLLLESNQQIYGSISDVPDQMVRTPLQRAIQVLKRHRDVHFAGRADEKYRPISIIITTLAARVYQGETDTHAALEDILTKLSLHGALLEDQSAVLDRSVEALRLISRQPDGRWYVPNPVDPDENFADRWDEDNHARARAFFQWLGSLHGEIIAPLTAKEGLSDARRAVRKSLGLVGPSVIVPARAEKTELRSYPRVDVSNPGKPWSF